MDKKPLKDGRKLMLEELSTERIQAIPGLRSFVSEVEGRTLKQSEEFFDCASALRRLGATDFLGDLVNHELKKFVNDPQYVPVMSFESQTIIIKRPGFELSIGLVDSTSNPFNNRVDTLAGHCMLLVMAPRGIAVEHFRNTEAPASEMLDRSSKLQSTGTAFISPGDLVRIEAGWEAIRFHPTHEHALVLNFSTTPFLDFIWEYDTRTNLPVRFVPADVTNSRIEYAVQLLSEMQALESIPVLTALANAHAAHFVRWASIRSVASLDPNAAMPLVSEALSDPHPEVRKAAQLSADIFREYFERQATGTE